jgi:hypothetical protein
MAFDTNRALTADDADIQDITLDVEGVGVLAGITGIRQIVVVEASNAIVAVYREFWTEAGGTREFRAWAEIPFIFLFSRWRSQHGRTGFLCQDIGGNEDHARHTDSEHNVV